MNYTERVIIKSVKKTLQDGGFVVKGVELDTKNSKIEVGVCFFIGENWSPEKMEIEKSKFLNRVSGLFGEYGPERNGDKITFKM